MTTYARRLSEREQKQLVQAFDNELYEMGATFVWSRAMTGLKSRLGTLGIEFIAEMLDRSDIRQNADVHEVLTDFEAVRLAEELGMFGGTQAMRLRHTLELVTHFAMAGPQAEPESEMTPDEAFGALRTCIQTILGHEDLEVALEFAEFRARLEDSVLSSDAPEIDGLGNAAYFFKRTVLRVLLAGSKSARGAQLENVLANLNVILPAIWPSLLDPDRYMVGRAYAELHAEGQSKAANGLRSALLKVAGFDFVPEGPRSREFLDAASRLQEAHFGWDNFYNEPAPMRTLASLGTSIPPAAFHKCMTAIILVRIGNRYGVSLGAQEDANVMLGDVTADRWEYFFNRCLPVDDVLLGQLPSQEIAKRWCAMLADFPATQRISISEKRPRDLWIASVEASDPKAVAAAATRLLAGMR